MTIKPAMNFLGIKSKITMRKYSDSGELPSRWVETKSGKWRIYKKSDLVAFKTKMNRNVGNGYSYLPFKALPITSKKT